MALVTDRTESDALLGNEKGLYSYTDLNRVETAVSEIVEQFPSFGVSEQLTVKTDWGLPGDFSAAEWPVASQMARYLGNVAKIKSIFIISNALPNTMENLTWHGANSIEKVLEIAVSRIAGIKQTYRYSGEIYAGEGAL